MKMRDFGFQGEDLIMNRREFSRISTLGLAAVAAPRGVAQATVLPTVPVADQSSTSRGAWFKEARFGMFIHFALFTLLERDCLVQFLENIPVDEYAKLKDRFNPTDFSAKEWVQIAKDAGQRYITLITKHHEGFALFATKLSDFNIMHSPFGRDLCAEVAEECHRQNLTINFYFSLMDWHSPLYQPSLKAGTAISQEFLDFTFGQVRELCTNYGKLGALFFDGHWDHTPEQWHTQELVAMIRKLQPDALINNRMGLPADRDSQGDYNTPEVAQAGIPKKPGRLWENNSTINDSWGYDSADTRYKSASHIVHLLVSAVGGGPAYGYQDVLPVGGNLLLNVGPLPSGKIPPQMVAVLHEVGGWLKRNGESIYGADSFRHMYYDQTYVTRKGDKVYLHLFDWAPGAGCDLTLLGLDDSKRAYFLETGQPVEITHTHGWGVRLTAKNTNPRPSPDTVIVFEGAVPWKEQVD